ncbi:MAG: phosphoribosyl-ATP diphosphatase [Gammaproteobacteria bacterium]
MQPDVLQRLAATIQARRGTDPASSYTARLLGGPIDALLKKIGEEATELVLAGKGGVPAEAVHEAADLWYHTLVLLARMDLGPGDVLAELERRFGQSGIAEKASRGTPSGG